MNNPQSSPVLELVGVSKSFGSVVALRTADLALYGGSIHALVGENGAGKSTLVKIMAGLYHRDSGSMEMDGQVVNFKTTAEAKAAGIAVIYHEAWELRTGLRAASALAAVSLFLVAGCSSSTATGGTSSAAKANLAITFLPKNLGNAYFDTSDKGGKAAIGELVGTYAEVGPAKAAPDAQVQYINTLTQQGVGGIVVSANDKAAICDALTAAWTRRSRSSRTTRTPTLSAAPVHQPGHRRRHRQG